MISIKGIDEQPTAPQPAQSNLFNPAPIHDPIINNAPDDTDPIQTQAIMAATLGARVEITGSWVWAQFNGKPEASVLTQLKANKWIWCKNKSKWAWRGAPCHSKKTMSWEYITNKYGIRVVDTENKLARI